MYEAASHFRRAQEISRTNDDWAKATYWVILTELALGDYGSAVRDMDELDRIAPRSVFARDMGYHRARAYFNQGYFEDALVYFKRFNDSIAYNNAESSDRKAASFFWMGECLYSMGQFDEAEKFYLWVVTQFPYSPKVEVSNYRIDLIRQKKIEAELLALLRWSHEESLKTSEDYQRRIRTYENTLNAYQRRIAELTQGGLPVNVEETPLPPSDDSEPAAERSGQ
jgi:tetratricopeptide (TPR) repeat protein